MEYRLSNRVIADQGKTGKFGNEVTDDSKDYPQCD